MTVLGVEVKDEVIPGTNIYKPRDRKPEETEDEYTNNYLIGEYYTKFYPLAVERFKEMSNVFIEDEVETGDIEKYPLFQSILWDEQGLEQVTVDPLPNKPISEEEEVQPMENSSPQPMDAKVEEPPTIKAEDRLRGTSMATRSLLQKMVSSRKSIFLGYKELMVTYGISEIIPIFQPSHLEKDKKESLSSVGYKIS